MSANDDLEQVIRLACVTEDRTDSEQRALINLAWKCDVAHNQHTIQAISRRGDGWVPWDLTGVVLETRQHGDGDRVVPPPKGREKRWATWQREST